MTRERNLRGLPSVNEALEHPDAAGLIGAHGRGVVKYAVRKAIERARARMLDGAEASRLAAVVADAADMVKEICAPTLSPVVNATGVVLHTNLGRAPLGQAVLDEVVRVAGGYSNLEFDLTDGRRSDRNAHLRKVLQFLTGAEGVLVVNNNAAGIVLALHTLARGREVVVSRGELVEIGGAFRIPEIMAASGARMREVGTTNRTRLADYEAAIGPETALLFKVHKSNYAIRGFTEEASVKDLAALAHARGLPLIYDIGSGLLRRSAGSPLEDEPDVRGALADGADLVLFSCDKLLGGPQAGALVGRSELVAELASAPLMRALRVGKLTLAALSAACRAHLRDEDLAASNPAFAMLGRSAPQLERLASRLLDELKRLGVAARMTESAGQCGGGALPDLRLRSVAVEVLPQGGPDDEKKLTFAERLFGRLLRGERPVLGVLREGRLLLDMLTVFEEDIPCMARTICEEIKDGAAP